MIVIAIIGILAAIALPAYAKYMARARFTEVTTALDGVKKQVELCIFDLGQTGYKAKKAIKVDVTVKKEGCSNTAANSGNGWRLGLPGDYATKFVKTIGVDANGVITATANKGNGLNEAVIQVIPMNGAATADNGVIDWQRNTNEAVSTCIKEDLC